MEQAQHRDRLAVVPRGQATISQHPRQRALHDPAVTTQPLGRLHAPPGDPRRDAPSSQRSPVCRVVVALVAVQLLRAESRPTGLADGPADRRDGVDQRLQELRIVDVRGGQPEGERDAPPIDQDVVLRTALAAVSRVRPRLGSPLFARTLVLSKEARLRSTASRSPSQFSRVRCAPPRRPVAATPAAASSTSPRCPSPTHVADPATECRAAARRRSRPGRPGRVRAAVRPSAWDPASGATARSPPTAHQGPSHGVSQPAIMATPEGSETTS
jgi:hypothetical protein